MGFPNTKAPRASFSRPADGDVVDINPPGFCWWRAGDADHYRFVITDPDGQPRYEADTGSEPVHVPDTSFPPGPYVWYVLALDDSDREIDRWGPRSFTIAEGAPEQPWIDPGELLNRAPDRHPRVIFQQSQLEELRGNAQASRREAVASLRQHADRCLELAIPEEPTYDQLEDPTVRRMSYTYAFRDFRQVIDNGMEPLALAYLFTGECQYGEHAVRLLTAISEWDPEGVSSILAPYGDEIGLSFVKTEAHCYDWLYDLMSEEQRDAVRRMLIARADQMLRRLTDRCDFLALPAESHAGRLPGYLCEHAIALAEEPRARAWLDYALKAICTVFPHWGGPDGGWAEGIGYGRAYNSILLPPFEAVRIGLGLDLWQRPFFRKVRWFFFYGTSPVGEVAPFGDGGTRGGPQGAAPLMLHYAQLFEDRICRWWVDQANPDVGRSRSLIGLILPDRIKPEPPEGIPSDAAFRGVGWAALHGDLPHPEEDTFILFKSSPYGSISHSHADQNCFCVLRGGKALATSSGYYGPSYGMPHHAKWTRQTKAHCGILVNGEGQIDRSAEAKGSIHAFRSSRRIGYLCGDAAAAYGDRLTRFLRHIVLIRPGLFCVFDELEASQPSSFQWLLHAFEPFEMDETGQTVVSQREGHRMEVHLRTPGGFEFSQTDRFDTPYNEGNPPQFHEDVPNHHHFTASTGESPGSRYIVAFGIVGRSENPFEGRSLELPPGWVGIEAGLPDGTGRIVARMIPEAAVLPQVPEGVLLKATWIPHEGEGEAMEIPLASSHR